MKLEVAEIMFGSSDIELGGQFSDWWEQIYSGTQDLGAALRH